MGLESVSGGGGFDTFKKMTLESGSVRGGFGCFKKYDFKIKSASYDLGSK